MGHGSGASRHVLSSKRGWAASAARRMSCGIPAMSVVHLYVLVPVPRASRAKPRRDEPVELAVKDALGVARAAARAQVLHHLVGLEHVAADLAAPADL